LGSRLRYEQEIIRGLNVPFADLSSLSGDEKEAATLDALNRGDALVYSGRITAMDLVGEPDLLRREGLGYVAGDIKSGAGLEGANEDSDGRPKKHYAAQLALYTEILEGIGVSAGRTPFVWDIHADEVRYDLDSPQGQRKPESLWDSYQEILDLVRAIVSGKHHTLPDLMSDCKLCHWRTLCKKHVREAGDLTLIPELGRAKRDAMVSTIPTIDDLARADIGTWTKGKKTVFPGIGPESFSKFQTRARLLTDPDAKPYVVHPVDLPPADTELFFDIETDPMRNICYLHGFVERKNSGNPAERYHASWPPVQLPKRRSEPLPRLGHTSDLAGHARSTTTPSTRGHGGDNYGRGIQPWPPNRTSRRYSTVLWRSISILICRDALSGPRTTIPSRPWRRTWDSHGETKNLQEQHPSSGTIAGSNLVTRPSASESSTTTRMTA